MITAVAEQDNLRRTRFSKLPGPGDSGRALRWSHPNEGACGETAKATEEISAQI